MVTAVCPNQFIHDGRGPELIKVFWGDRGGWPIRAINYYNPEDNYEEVPIKHVRFERSQVVMVTPEEVIGYEQIGEYLSELAPAAMFNLGRSDWLKSFSPRHLEKCSHFQLLFYDELFDVIAESVNCFEGGYGRAT